VEPSDVVAVVALVVSPAAALAGVWLTARLTEKSRRAAQADAGRTEALAALARFMSVVVDAEPTLVYTGDLREYPSPTEAVKGLYVRWAAAREPMLLLSLTHPKEQIRQLCFQVQAEAQIVLRQVDDAIQASGDLDPARRHYEKLTSDLSRLGQLLSAAS
jgi:hypothetical protein